LPKRQLTISYEDLGRGPPLVLLHAFLLDRRMWEAQSPELSREFRVIALDLPGFGDSGEMAAGMSVDGAADVVAEFLDAIGVRGTVALGGLSMGGYVALAFARRHAHRLNALILANTSADPDSEMAKANRLRLAALLDEHGVTGLLESLVGKAMIPGDSPRHAAVWERVPQIVREQATCIAPEVPKPPP
jgi:3-oxoadipate enol-lactonase